MNVSFDFSGRIALVTGATSGIGKATALAFAKAKATVVFTGRREAEGKALEKEITALGVEALFAKSDVADTRQIQKLFEIIEAKFGRLDYAFNNAGIECSGKQIHEQILTDFTDLMNINVTGLFSCMQAEVGLMLKGSGGAIVNNSSIGGLVTFPGLAPYHASKFAVMGLTKSAALDYAASGIRVNAVNPGIIKTDMIDRMGQEMGEEIADAVLFLCSDAAAYITGQGLVVDGGMLATA
jgi:NAD(P)-dependent dehydrogenase (short-subunit alcohol dehydrogenase family)